MSVSQLAQAVDAHARLTRAKLRIDRLEEELKKSLRGLSSQELSDYVRLTENDHQKI